MFHFVAARFLSFRYGCVEVRDSPPRGIGAGKKTDVSSRTDSARNPFAWLNGG
jgi:hypothetical protein